MSVLLLCFSFSSMGQNTFVVNSTDDNPDVDLVDGICGDVNGNCTLRSAVENANLSSESDIINFNIAGEGPHVIYLLENLPPITEPVILDATTQPGYTWSTPKIVMDGTNLELFPDRTPISKVPKAFYLIGNSSGSTIKGFVIGGFGFVEENESGETLQYHLGMGISSENSTGHQIQSNFIGVKPDGKTPYPNVFGITTHHGDGHLIGGYQPEDRNLIGASWRSGILVGFESENNKIIGNFIGLSADGMTAVSNSNGIDLSAPSFGNLVENNVVSGNDGVGIYAVGKNNTILSNRVGTNPDGNLAIPNDWGIAARSEGNIIGQPGKGNLVSGNVYAGIYVLSSSYSPNSNSVVQGNYVGSDLTGLKPIPNGTGVALDGSYTSNITVGGAVAGEGNLISGNLGEGLLLIQGTSDNQINGNFIGTAIDGLSAMGNGGSGILIEGHRNQVGHNLSNTIAFNSSGVAINSGFENAIVQNKILSNLKIGIDLASDGISSNDRDDRDLGPNNLQNFPEILEGAIIEKGLLSLEFLLPSDPANSAFPVTIHFYKSDGARQGVEYLGSHLYTVNDVPKGKNTVQVALNLVSGNSLKPGDLILSTATDANGNTSEYSAEVQVNGNCTIQTWYADTDGDSYGMDSADSNISSCTQPAGNYFARAGDCDDSDAAINPDAEDIPDDGIDQNCDGKDATTAIVDTDGDSFADSVDNCPEVSNPDQLDSNGNGIGDACENPVCLGTDTLNVTDCTSGSNIYWTVTNPGECAVDVKWEVRKGTESGTITLNAGESQQFTTSVASRGQTQVILYWKDSTGAQVQMQSNASGSSCATTASLNSSTVEEEKASAESPYAYPNPVGADGFYISFPLNSGGKLYYATIYDLNSKVITENIFEVPVGGANLFWAINTGGWIPGVYLLNLKNGSESFQLNLLKE